MLKQAKDLIQDEIWFFEQAQLIYDTRASSNNNFDVLVKQYNNTKTAMKENLKALSITLRNRMTGQNFIDK